MKEREEAKRARGELPEPTPKDKQPKKRGRKPKIDWSSMSEEVCKVFIITIIIPIVDLNQSHITPKYFH